MADDPSFDSSDPPVFGFTELDTGDRQDLVNLTIAPAGDGGAPMQANLLQLSALGANMDLGGSWYAPGVSDVAHFHSVSSLGRLDHGVMVRRGYLFPFGHAAIATEIHQRAPGVDPATSGGGRYAVGYVQQQTFITVTQPELSYPLVGQPWPSGAGFGTSNFPFRSVRIVSTLSPPLDPPNEWWEVGPAAPGPPDPVPPTPPQFAWPTINGGTPYAFNFILTDLTGTEIHCRMPIAFCYAADWGDNYVSEFGIQDPIVVGYTGTDLSAGVTWANAHGRTLQFCPPSTEGVSTSHPALVLRFGASDSGLDPTVNANPPGAVDASTLQAAVQPNFYPVLASAWIRTHAADVLAGKGVSDGSGPAAAEGGIQVEYYPDFVQGFETSGRVYLTFPNAPALTMPANNVGGVAAPNFSMTGLSASQGVFGGNPDTYASQGSADLTDYFKIESSVLNGVSQLLGGLQLGDILDASNFNTPSITTTSDPATGVVSVAYSMQTQLSDWPSASDPNESDIPSLLQGASPPAIFVPQGGNLTLQVNVTMDPATGASSYTANGSIDPFDIWLLGNSGAFQFIHLEFTQFTFQGQSGSAPTVQVNLSTVEFVGVLSFVQTLEQFLQGFGLGALTIDVEPDEVNADLSISLPTVAVGIFSLSGISFAAGITLPFINGPAVATFAFASQDNPFTLTVAMFGGGGYIQLGLGFGGVQSFAASLDFCGQLAFDIGIASGGLSLSAGITYAWSESAGASLTGWVKIAGSLEVFGLVTITATLELSLDYYPSSGVMQGTASFHASISVGCFSVPFGFSVTKSFGGSGSGAESSIRRAMAMAPLGPAAPAQAVTFAALCDSDAWDAYCDAFTGSSVTT